MKPFPQVSIVMVNFNRGSFLREAIESVRRQTFRNFEFIIIENGSTDESWRIIQDYAHLDQRIRPMKLNKRVRIAAAANMGVREARGEFVARLDSDDVWLDDKLEVQIDFLSRTCAAETGICGAQCALINRDGAPIGRKTFPLHHDACLNAFWHRNPFSQSTVLIRKQCFNDLGLYNEEFEVGEDLELWIRLSQKYRLCNLPEILVLERVWAHSVRMSHYRLMVDATLKVRHLAVTQYGYSMSLGARVTWIITWCARWFPPLIARWIFAKLVACESACPITVDRIVPPPSQQTTKGYGGGSTMIK